MRTRARKLTPRPRHQGLLPTGKRTFSMRVSISPVSALRTVQKATSDQAPTATLLPSDDQAMLWWLPAADLTGRSGASVQLRTPSSFAGRITSAAFGGAVNSV